MFEEDLYLLLGGIIRWCVDSRSRHPGADTADESKYELKLMRFDDKFEAEVDVEVENEIEIEVEFGVVG